MSYAEHRALVVGAAGLDLKVQPRTAVVELGRSNPGLIRWGWGGVARNIAENLARLSVEVRLITAVGDDWWGHVLLARLRDLGINTDACMVSSEHPTSSYVALSHSDRLPWVAFHDMAAISEVTPGYLHRLRGLVRDADIVCIDTNLSARTLQTLFRLTSEYDSRCVLILRLPCWPIVCFRIFHRSWQSLPIWLKLRRL